MHLSGIFGEEGWRHIFIFIFPLNYTVITVRFRYTPIRTCCRITCNYTVNKLQLRYIVRAAQRNKLPISSPRGRRAKMTEATQTTFFRDFFGKEMSENSGLATQYLLVYSDAVPGSIFRRWSRPIKAFFTRSPWSGLSDFHLPHVCAV